MYGLIVDVVVIVIALLFIIFGVWRGMYKLIFGLVSSLAAIVLAVVLASTVTSLVINKTSLDELLYKNLDEKLQGVLPADLDASAVEIVYNTDTETGEVTVSITHGADTFETVSEYIASTGSSISTVSSIVNFDNIINSSNTMSMLGAGGEEAVVTTTLARVFSAAAIVYILLAAVFVVLWILLYIVIRFIMFLIKKLVTATYVGHFLDKVLGLAVGGAFALIIIWGALAVIRLLGAYTWIIPVNEVINSSTVTKLLYDNNILYNFLVQSSNVQKSIAEVLGNFGVKGSQPETATEAEAATEEVIGYFTGLVRPGIQG